MIEKRNFRIPLRAFDLTYLLAYFHKLYPRGQSGWGEVEGTAFEAQLLRLRQMRKVG